MKANLIIAITTSVLTTIGVAQADSIRLEGVVEAGGRVYPMTSMEWGWTPTNFTETFKVAGLTCTFGTSAAGAVATGCNYTVRLYQDGSSEISLRNGNSVCTQVQPSCQ